MATKKPAATPRKFDYALTEPEDGIFNFYSNIINLNWTLHDVRIRFGELIQIPNRVDPRLMEQDGVVEERVAVTMPWAQAKYIRDQLDVVIKKYEELNGEMKQINLPAW